MSLPASTLPAPLMPLPTYAAIFAAMAEAYHLRSRKSQLDLSELVRSAIQTSGVFCGEAPTGTGKTLGYLAGALDAQAHMATPMPIVVATATVGLQEQILRDDIPRLAAVGALDPRKVAVAKGRGRYFCPRTCAMLEDRKMRDTQHDMFNSEKHVADAGAPIALDMLRAWREDKWDGDRDSWKGIIPDCWDSACGASSDTCVNRACEYFDKCPYMASRQKLAVASVIVANHDIVLADLKQRSEEQQNTVLPVKKYALIIDEAHNFPDKAISTRKAKAVLTEPDWLRKMEVFGESCLTTPMVAKILTKSNTYKSDIFSVGAQTLMHELDDLAKTLKGSLKFQDNGVYSWGLKELDPTVLGAVNQLGFKAAILQTACQDVSKAFAEFAEQAIGAEKAFAIRMLAHAHTFQRQASELLEGLSFFAAPEPMVRWVYKNKQEVISLNVQPLEAKDVLDNLLWAREMPVVMVSATLQIAGSFNRFKSKTGLPASAVTAILPPVFDYSRGFLHQVSMDCSPDDDLFESEIVEKLNTLYSLNIAQGTLVLFTSRESMRRVVRQLSTELAGVSLVQDYRPVPELIAAHKERIDDGKRSVLMGLDSMAEGLDLPGNYCGHVIITRLPFAVPGDPVESARKDFLGKAWFEEAYLADMLTMLIQATGRLIRRENDYGLITLMDNRLSKKRYGIKSLKALPEFTRGTKVSQYRKMVIDRELATIVTPKPAAAKLTLVPAPSAPAAPVAPVAVAPTATPVVDPMEPIFELCAGLASTRTPIKCDLSSLNAALNACLSVELGPFPDDEAQFLNCAEPCLPAGTAAYVWSERCLPQATLLGLHLRNTPWEASAPLWQKILKLRPDLIQFTQVLRSYCRDLHDVRREALPEEVCRLQLQKGLASVIPSDDDLFEFLDTMEAEVVTILNNRYVLPSQDLLDLMPRVARELRK